MIRWNVSDVSMPTPSSHIQHPACKRQKAGQGKILKANQKPQRTRREQMQEVGDAWWKTGKQTKTGSKTRHFQHKTEINWTGTGTNGVLTVKNVPIIWSGTCYRHSWSIWCLHRRKNQISFTLSEIIRNQFILWLEYRFTQITWRHVLSDPLGY